MSTLTSTQLQQQYIAYFGRPGDPAGLKYWLSSSSGISSAREFADKIYAQDEYKTSTVGSKSTEQQVNQLYKNLFGREADAAGLIYWTGEIEAGNLVLSNVAYDLIWAASNPVSGNSTQATTDAAALANKVAAAEAFTTEVEASTSAILAYQPESTSPWKSGSAFNEAVSFVTSATSSNAPTAADVTASITTITAVSTSTSGTNYTLTNTDNQTTGGADNFTGGSGDDSFLATSSNSLDNGDVIDGGAGTDTLTARYALTANKTVLASITNVEKLIVDVDDGDDDATHSLTIGVDGFTGLTEVVAKNADSSSANEDSIIFNNIAAGVELGITNGDADSDVDFVFKTTTGATDTATLNLNAAKADEVTIAGIETVTIDGESGTSVIDTMVTAAATKYVMTGSGKVTLSDIGDTVTTLDASASTGGVVIGGVGAVNATITGGSGADTLSMGTSLTTNDTIDLGAGIDRIKVGETHTTALPKVTSVEVIEMDVDSQANTTLELSGKAFASATQFAVDALVDAVGNSTTLTISNLDDNDEIIIEASGASSTGIGTKVTGTLTAETNEDDITVTLKGIGALTADPTNNTGIATITLDSHETINLVANKNSTGAVKTNGIDNLEAAVAQSIVITSGGGEIDIDAITNTTALTSIDSTGSSANVTIDGLDASKLVYKAGSGTNVISLAGLNSDDQLIGGSATADVATGTGVSGLTALTGILNVQDFESVYIEASGGNTIDASKLSGVNTFGIYGASPTAKQTVTNLDPAVAFSVGNSTAEFDGGIDIDISLADETGTSDSLTVKIDNRGGASTDADIHTSSTIESVTLDVLDLDTVGNNAAVTMTEADAATIVLQNGMAGQSLTLGTLSDSTLTVDAASLKSDFSFTAGTTASGMTVTTGAAQDDTDLTLSAKDDTLTVGSTGAVVIDMDGGAGTDTINLNVKSGFANTTELANFETINFIVNAGDDISLGANGGAATDANAVPGATTVNISGGNSLSTFEVGDLNAGSADNITAAVDIDSTAFLGNVFLEYAADVFTASTDVDAGALTTDQVYALFETTGDDIALPLTGVDIFTTFLNSGNTAANETFTFDVDGATGLSKVQLVSSSNNNQTAVIDDYVDTVTIELGAKIGSTSYVGFNNSSILTVNHKNADGASDVLNLTLGSTDNRTGTIDINAAGTETLNLAVSTDTSDHKIDLAGVTATSGSKTTVNITGGVSSDYVEITTTPSTMNVIDASSYLGSAVVLTDRNSAAMTITTNTGADTLRMENTADVIDAGSGTDTLNVAKTLVLGGIEVDLTSTTDQITTFNGAANTGVQKGFENIDLSGVGGSFGASITAISTGSTITGTKNADTITLGSSSTVQDIIHTDGGLETSANKNDKVDIISNFTVGSSKDQVAIDISELETAGAIVTGVTLNFVELGATGNATKVEVTADTAVSFQTIDTNGEIANANAFILLDTNTTYADADTAVNAFESSGSYSINHNTNLAASDAFLFAYENSSGGVTVAAAFLESADTHANQTGATTHNAANLSDGLLNGVDLFTFDDISDVTTLDATNFDLV